MKSDYVIDTNRPGSAVSLSDQYGRVNGRADEFEWITVDQGYRQMQSL